MKQTNKVMQKIKLIEFVTSLKLEPEERNSLVYSNGISTYWEIYRSYKLYYAMEVIKSFIPVIGLLAVGSTLVELLSQAQDKPKQGK